MRVLHDATTADVLDLRSDEFVILLEEFVDLPPQVVVMVFEHDEEELPSSVDQGFENFEFASFNIELNDVCFGKVEGGAHFAVDPVRMWIVLNSVEGGFTAIVLPFSENAHSRRSDSVIVTRDHFSVGLRILREVLECLRVRFVSRDLRTGPFVNCPEGEGSAVRTEVDDARTGDDEFSDVVLTREDSLEVRPDIVRAVEEEFECHLHLCSSL